MYKSSVKLRGKSWLLVVGCLYLLVVLGSFWSLLIKEWVDTCYTIPLYDIFMNEWRNLGPYFQFMCMYCLWLVVSRSVAYLLWLWIWVCPLVSSIHLCFRKYNVWINRSAMDIRSQSSCCVSLYLSKSHLHFGWDLLPFRKIENASSSIWLWKLFLVTYENPHHMNSEWPLRSKGPGLDQMPKNGDVTGTYSLEGDTCMMSHRIYKYEIGNWWEKWCEDCWITWGWVAWMGSSGVSRVSPILWTFKGLVWILLVSIPCEFVSVAEETCRIPWV